jgi:Protein of unknown function (DUF3040)
MALSRRERRVLAQLGRVLAAEDPELVAQLSAPRGRAVSRRVATMLSAVGAVVLVLGVLIQVWELLLLALLLGVGCWVPVLFDKDVDW